ncbi:peptidoglycan DD-metalloendopeptidase family protein [Lysinibacillus fusiformis]|uniref:Peptidase family M23 n=1 Tax=Lysinibacillus fusiformis TaxID=28031 RepID=A0A1H9MZX0_9BACI|nr:peptidoglycan DD-metalloendopeptidase family protein [Lysinibacillus fusiformis]SCY65178.1 Peptidase family M23 [Lysinibacillus fusiformis]SEO04902.1 Peptidase family M23 [Lysinibacillus fusiformis]SER29077.1 Peptidase family M23 [Lysinibacillus fusiformis]
MSTGGEQKKPTEFLVALKINDRISKQNISTYLKKLKNIPNLSINLDVTGLNTQIFNEYGKQIKALEQQLEAFHLKLQNVGTESSAPLSIFEDFKQGITNSLKSIDTLNEIFDDVHINVKEISKQLAKIPTGDLQSLQNLASQLKVEMETISTNQFKLYGIQEAQQNLQALESNLYNIYELQKAYANTTDFDQLASQITDLNTQLTNIQLGEGLNIAGISDISNQIDKMSQSIVAFGKNTAEAGLSSTAFASAIMDGIGLASTFKTLGEDILGTGTAFAGRALFGLNAIGIAISAGGLIIGKILEERKKQIEELKTEEQEILKAYTSNASEIDTQFEKYYQLENAIELGNTDPSVISEYQEISNRLGEILPNLVTQEDEFGNKIIGSAEALKVKIGLLKEQQAIEAEIANQAIQDKRNDDIDIRKRSISDLEDSLNSNIDSAARVLSTHANSSSFVGDVKFYDNNFKPLLKTAEDFEKKLKELGNLQSKAEKSGDTVLANYYKELSTIAKSQKDIIVQSDNELKQEILSQKNDYIANIADVINENNKLTDSVKNNSEAFAAQLIASANMDDLDTLQNSLTSLFSNENASSIINEIVDSFQNMDNSTSETFESMANKTKENMESISTDLSKLGLSKKEVSSIMGSLNQHFEDTTQKQKELSVEMKVNNLTFAEAKAKVEGYKAEVKNLTTTHEKLAGVSQKRVNDTSDLLLEYQLLTNQLKDHTEEEIRNLSQKSSLTAEEQRLVDVLNSRDLVMNNLNTLYPSLINQDGKAISLSAEKIKAIQAENHANETLLKAYQLARQGKLSIQQQNVVDEASFTKATIENIKKNIQALNILQAKLQEVYNEQVNNMKNEDPNSYTYGYGAYRSGTLLGQTQSQINDYTSELNELQKSLDTNISTIDSFDTSLGKTTKTTNQNISATKNTVYITDKYKQKLEELNLGIEKQQRLLSKLPEHSSEYRRALETQIQFEKEKLRVMQQQEASLKNQIASGKIQQTGNITSKSPTSSTTTNLNGWSGKITSAYGGRKDPITGKSDNHLGMDISGSKGTRLDANVAGKIIASGDAIKNGYDGSYGNIVVVQDANNFKHLYAHLDKAIAKMGDYVDVGTQIGNIGASGRVTGPHLHYEVKNANGQRLDPTSYYTAAKNGATSSPSYAVDTAQQAIDQTKSELVSLQQQILNQKDLVEDLERGIIDSYLSSFENKKTTIDNLLETSDNRLRKLTVTSESYRKELDRQTAALNDKKKINQNEIAYLEGVIKSGTASKKVIDEYTQRLHELNNVNSEIDFAIWDVGSKKVESYMSKYEEQRQIQDNVIAYEKAKLGELDTSSARYVKSLVNINNAMKEKQNANLYELTQLKSLVNGNKGYGDGLQSAKKRIEELTIGMKELQVDIQDSDYDILINIKTQSDEKINNIESEINRAELIRKMFDEGSADYEKYTNIMINAQERIAQQHLETRDNLLEELKQRDITAERIKEITKLINEEYNGYLNATLAIKDYTKQKDDAKKAQLDKIADKVISAYKDYHQELRDEQIKQLDEEIERENKKHETIMKNLQEEMDLFRKSVEDKLRLIDREEAQRSYDMEISDLESERNDVQSKLNILALDNSYEAKAKRKSLQEQLDEIDKTIAEKRHNREIDLRKESLNDALESKEEEINEKIELQESEHENLVNKINLEKEHWESYYSDLLNNERQFAKMREDIINGHLTNVEADFNQYRDKLKASLPEISGTLDDTMKAIGFSIRDNVILELEEALDLIKKFNDSQESKDNGSFESNLSNPQTSKGKLSNADLQVLLGKFLYDRVLPNVSGQDQSAVSEMAKNFAAKGRDKADSRFTENGANFNESTRVLTQAEMDSLSEYLNSNKNLLGGKYNSFFEQFFNENSGNTQVNESKLSDADMKVMLGKFIYEKLVPEPSLNANTKMALKNKADNLASEGRNEDSQISENVTFDSVKNKYSSEQIQQLKTFFNYKLDLIENLTTRELMKKKIASLDSGGFMNWTGIGIDGKGGKAIIAHPQEIMLNKADTQSLFNSINIMDSIMNNLSPFLLKFTPFQKSSSVSTGDTYGDIKINFHIDKMNGDKNDLHRFSKMIDDDLLRRKGMRK